jgi:hypothetical protein
MICLCCDKKLRGIKEDGDYQNWQRKYHKTCWRDRNINYDLYLKTLKLPEYSSSILEYYHKKSCIN